ncbi:MAG: hypothetical protein K0Q49_2379 [Haloplasmataceae bacterium]|jgi:hypothetical protein|nr:hypothetical protein [Haloplasmataceae bacterium]
MSATIPLITFFIFIGLIAVIFSVIFNILRKDKSSNSINKTIASDYMPYKSKYILTSTEYNFYKSLKIITDNKNLIICPKVGLKDMIDITDKSNYMKWFGQISQKHIDFLICDNDLKPLFAIELDDKSHDRTKAQKNDDFKNKLFSKIGLPLKRIRVGDYSGLDNYLFPNDSL